MNCNTLIKGHMLYSILATRSTTISLQHHTVIFAGFIKKYKLISCVIHSHVEDPLGLVDIIAFSCSPFETFASEWEIS